MLGRLYSQSLLGTMAPAMEQVRPSLGALIVAGNRMYHPSAPSAMYAQLQPAAQPSWILHTMAPQVKALLIDAAGTLLIPSERCADVYLRYGRKYGCDLSEPEILQRFRR